MIRTPHLTDLDIADAEAAGVWVRRFEATLPSEFTVVDKDGSRTTSLVDTSVYAKGQVRLLNALGSCPHPMIV